MIRRILVTGTEGYLGSLLAPELLRHGYEVIGLDTGFYKERMLYRANDPAGQLAPTITYEINHKDSIHLAELARKAGVRRFVYMSSCSVYGVSEGDDCD